MTADRVRMRRLRPSKVLVSSSPDRVTIYCLIIVLSARRSLVTVLLPSRHQYTKPTLSSIMIHSNHNTDQEYQAQPLNLNTNIRAVTDKLILDLQRLSLVRMYLYRSSLTLGRSGTCQATPYFGRHRLFTFQAELWYDQYVGCLFGTQLALYRQLHDIFWLVTQHGSYEVVQKG